MNARGGGGPGDDLSSSPLMASSSPSSSSTNVHHPSHHHSRHSHHHHHNGGGDVQLSPRSEARISAALSDVAALCQPDSDEEGEISEDEIPFQRLTPPDPSFRSRSLEFLNLPSNVTRIALQEALSRIGEVEEVVSSRSVPDSPGNTAL
ncbi:rna recognition motif (or rnp domain) protein, partial [Cystoisospora suis]